jgi:hypothetical protein
VKRIFTNPVIAMDVGHVVSRFLIRYSVFAMGVLISYSAIAAQTISIPVFSTGVAADRSLLPGGSIDPHFTLISSADSDFPGPAAIVASRISSRWQPNGPDAKWIAPSADQMAPGANPCNPNGTYIYRTSFSLRAVDPTTAVISGNWAADDIGTAVLLNGVNVGATQPEYTAVQPLLINSGFVTGLNTLDFVLTNTNGCPTGLRVELSGTALALPVSIRRPNDINGDGKSDLLFRNSSNGQISAWLMNGNEIQSTGGLVPPDSWTITHSADFNGDGKDDVLFRKDDGSATLWLMNGIGAADSRGLWSAASPRRIFHVGDFDGDGKADILFGDVDPVNGNHRNFELWLMNGTATTVSVQLSTPDHADYLGWKVPKVADFNGDGKADILWRHDDGTVVLQLMSGVVVANTVTILGPDANWGISHVGDFNGDGKADLLWRNTNGAVTVWLMNGGSVISAAGLIGPDPTWSVSHVGDFDGDGKSDILWRNTNGSVTVWLMDGIAVGSAVGILGPDPNWQVTHLADFNGDGKSDILWRNANDGSITMWLMSGAAVTSAAGLLGPSPWRVVPPTPY